MRILAIANQKGGVGKTTTTHALGVALASAGYHVLLVDMDPQATLTWACGVQDASGRSIADLLESTTPGIPPLARAIRPLARHLSLIPSDARLATVELQLAGRAGREKVVKNILNVFAAYYHVCLIDCPPSVGLLTLNALAAANAVLIPTQPQAPDLAALMAFTRVVDHVRLTLNPTLRLLGILVTLYDQRLLHHNEMLRKLAENHLPILRTRIGRSIRVAEALEHGQSVVSYAAANPQAEAYRQLAQEIIPWVKGEVALR